MKGSGYSAIGRRAFTLVESILAIIIISAMALVTGDILMSGMDTYALVVERREALQQARLATNFMTNELQTIADPATDISSIGATSITFTPAGGGGPVTYSVSGSNLMRGADILATNIGGATQFLYFTTGGAATSNPTQVYRIDLTVQIDANDPKFDSVTIKNGIYLRNRYYDQFTQT